MGTKGTQMDRPLGSRVPKSTQMSRQNVKINSKYYKILREICHKHSEKQKNSRCARFTQQYRFQAGINTNFRLTLEFLVPK